MKYLLLMIILLNACGSEKKEIKSREACKSDSCSVQSEDNVLDAANNPTSTPSHQLPPHLALLIPQIRL